MEFTWTKQMSVGNATLDSEHQQILSLVKEVDRAISARDILLFAQTLDRLEDVTRKHFAYEAKIAQAIDYRFEQHNMEHQYILNEFTLIKDELAAQQGKWSESVAEHYFHFLSNWATEHIHSDDMKMKASLTTYPYDFKPDVPAG